MFRKDIRRSLLFFWMFWITLMASPSKAFDLDALSVSLYCSAEQKDCSPRLSEYFHKAQLNCEIETQALGCQELVRENPELGALMKKCDTASLCQQEKDFLERRNQACLEGYKNAMIDLGVSVKNMAFSLAGLVESSWEKLKTDRKNRTAFLQQCHHSLSCKKDLVKEDHRYNQMPDAELMKLPASFLYTQARDLAAYRSSLDRVRQKPYVPLSERPRDDTDLDVEARVKLDDMAGMVKTQIEKQYTKYACYHPLAREELKCYIIGSVIDPTLVAGYFLKAGRAAVTAKKLLNSKVPLHDGRVGEAANSAVRHQGGRAEFTARYLSYSPTTAEQNAAWISVAERGASRNTRFLDVENSMMKELNDKLHDKNLVTSLTNYHKDILFKKVKELEAQYPGLKIEKYSDFKASRFAFSGQLPPDLDKKVAQIFSETNGEFASYLKAQGLFRDSDQAGTWFRAGWGQSADQANLSARYTRKEWANEVQEYSGGRMRTELTGKAKRIERDRAALETSLKNTSVIDGETLHTDAFDIIRKNKGDTAQMRIDLQQRFGLSELPESVVRRMDRYARNIDDFSPGIFVAKREFASLEDATRGGLSADIIGMGAQNLKGTAQALSRTQNLDRVLEETRLAEKAVTREFEKQKSTFEQVLRDSVGADKVKTVCSGDDCVAVAKQALTPLDKKKILNNLANTEYTGRYRLAFVPEGVRDGSARTLLTTHGESLEKKLRKSLSASMEPQKLRGLTFAADMRTTEVGRGQVDLLIGKTNGVNLSESERTLITNKFQEALKRLNEDLQKEGYSGYNLP